MMRRDNVAVVALSALMFAGLHGTFAQNADPVAQLPTLPGQDPATAPVPAPGVIPTVNVPPALGLPSAVPGSAPVLPGTAPALPGLPPTSPVPFGLPGGAPAAEDTIPAPPPLAGMEFGAADDNLGSTTATVANAATPTSLYEFLFIQDSDYGVVRQQFQADVAENLKEQEIQRLQSKRQSGQQPLGGAAIFGVTPGLGDPTMDPTLGGYSGQPAQANTGTASRAAAEWDFYYSQLEMYDRYIREKLIPEAEDLPTLEYNAANALQERQDLFESFQEAAITQNNNDFNRNKDFYERLQKREDRRTAYVEWTRLKQQQVQAWSEVWARKTNGTRWADGETVRVDDWYYGTDFNSAQPVTVAIDDREYVISHQPLRDLRAGQLNVISSNMTPYDIIDNNGYLKNPVMETLRGTLTIPPAPSVASQGTVGPIEVVGGSTAE